jgi:hypothetical protein
MFYVSDDTFMACNETRQKSATTENKSKQVDQKGSPAVTQKAV